MMDMYQEIVDVLILLVVFFTLCLIFYEYWRQEAGKNRNE